MIRFVHFLFVLKADVFHGALTNARYRHQDTCFFAPGKLPEHLQDVMRSFSCSSTQGKFGDRHEPLLCHTEGRPLHPEDQRHRGSTSAFAGLTSGQNSMPNDLADPRRQSPPLSAGVLPPINAGPPPLNEQNRCQSHLGHCTLIPSDPNSARPGDHSRVIVDCSLPKSSQPPISTAPSWLSLVSSKRREPVAWHDFKLVDNW